MANLPLHEPTFLILTTLAEEPRHGYGIIGEVATLSDGRVKLRPGTLYGALDRLTADGLVSVEREEVTGGRLRRYYELTDQGAAVLESEAERLRHNAEVATQRLASRSTVPATRTVPAT